MKQEKDILRAINFQILEPTVISELYKLQLPLQDVDNNPPFQIDPDYSVRILSEYLADLTLMCIEIRSEFTALDIAKACRIVSKYALDKMMPRSVFAGEERVEECCRQVRLMWMEFASVGHFTNRF